jgi:hypothetical protein
MGAAHRTEIRWKKLNKEQQYKSATPMKMKEEQMPGTKK